jgi:hypothetical protein
MRTRFGTTVARTRDVRRTPSGWHTVGRDDTTAGGAYRERIPDHAGVYRAKVKRTTLNAGADVCLADVSPRRRHHH